MLIKKNNTKTFVDLLFSKRKNRIVFLILFFLLCIGISFLAGGIAYKDGFFGKVLKPIIVENVRIPVNFVKSLGATPEHITIDINHTDFQKLAYKREVALKRGVLLSQAGDIVPAKIRWNNKTYDIKIRLKGDLADHWADSKKWSFRVKTKNDETIMGMRKFSLQKPQTRGVLNDWYLHKILKHIGGFPVLRYQFVKLTLNGKDLGIYNIEEHFDEMLLKNNGYIVSPIIRIYDHLLWYNIDPAIGFSTAHLNEHYTLSPIDAFNTNDTIENEDLLRNFNCAKNLLEAFRTGRLSTHEVFEVKRLAKLFAIIDLFGFRHTTAYSNIRFYYNPIAARLEPIGYDNTFILEAETIQGTDEKIDVLEHERNAYIDPDEWQIWYDTFFADKVFFREYIQALQIVSQKSFLDEIFSETEKDEIEALKTIYKSFPGYRFKGKETLYKNQEVIRKLIDPEQAVYAYYKDYDEELGTVTLEVGNIQHLPVQITGFALDDEFIPVENGEFFLQPKKAFRFVDYEEVSFSIKNLDRKKLSRNELKDDLEVHYQIVGSDNIKTVKVFPWSHLDDSFIHSPIIQKATNFKDLPFITINEQLKTITFEKGSWFISEPVIFPESYNIICSSGTTLNFSDTGIIVSYSPLKFIGAVDEPIVITSDVEETCSGIVIIDTPKKSIFENVIFRGLSSPKIGAYILDSALTAYETNIVLNHCQFEEVFADSALSIIRSDFFIKGSLIQNTENNAIEIFYSEGDIEQTDIVNVKKDGIVIYGSASRITDVNIKNIFNTGISASDHSEIIVSNSEIEECEIGGVSQNGSTLTLVDSKVSKCESGLRKLKNSDRFKSGAIVLENTLLIENKDDFGSNSL